MCWYQKQFTQRYWDRMIKSEAIPSCELINDTHDRRQIRKLNNLGKKIAKLSEFEEPPQGKN